MRTVPPDSVQGQVIANLVEHYKWRKIAILYSTQDYGSSIAQIVINAAAARNIEILTISTFYEGSTDLSSQMQTIKTSGARVTIVCCTNSDMVAVMRSASQANLIGENYVWIGSDATVQDSNFKFPNGTVREDILEYMQGMIGTAPSVGSGPLWDQFLNVWGSLDPNVWPGAGNRNVYNYYDPYVYDAVLAYAYAAQYFINQDRWPVDLSENFTTILKNYLLYNTSFEGLTGNVSFDTNGDRKGAYDIVNLKVNASGGHFTRVGGWTTIAGVVIDTPVVFSGGSTNVPSDGPPSSLLPTSKSKGSDNSTVVAAVATIGTLLVVAIIVTNVLYFYMKNRRKVLRPPDFKAIEFGEFMKAPMPSKKESLTLLSLEELILNTDFITLLVSLKQEPDAREVMLKAIFYVFRANRRALELMKFFTEREITNARLETLFREDSIATKMFRRYTKVVGLPYLWATLAPVLDGLNQEILKKEMQASDIQMASLPDEDYRRDSIISTSFEVDPSKLTDMDDEKINKLNLLLLCQKTFSAIVRSAEFFPPELKQTLAMIVEAIKKQFPGVDHHSYIGGFVFLRFYCSSMIAPHQYGLFAQPPGTSCQRVLVLLSKVIQNLSNGVSFGGKEDFLIQLNDFINVNAIEVRAFLDRLTAQDITISMEKQGTDYDVIPEVVLYESLRTLKEVITKNKSILFEKMEIQLNRDPESMKKTKQHLDLILSIE